MEFYLISKIEEPFGTLWWKEENRWTTNEEEAHQFTKQLIALVMARHLDERNIGGVKLIRVSEEEVNFDSEEI